MRFELRMFTGMEYDADGFCLSLGTPGETVGQFEAAWPALGITAGTAALKAAGIKTIGWAECGVRATCAWKLADGSMIALLVVDA